jgi:hypothetical protein
MQLIQLNLKKGKIMGSQKKFLIVSNARSGSTWLETLLGSLSDVQVDYEFKWRPTYEAHELHMVIPDKNFNCSDALSKISNKGIVGSKLVFDPRSHSDNELNELLQTIPSNIHVIHLVRSYAEVINSIIKGRPINILSENAKVEGDSVLLKTLKHNSQLDFEPEVSNEPKTINMGHCQRLLRNLFKNDLCAYKLKQTRDNYTIIKYDEIESELESLVSFIGSNASKEEIADSLSNPITKKLPKKSFHEVIQNYDDISETIGLCEELKQFLLV